MTKFTKTTGVTVNQSDMVSRLLVGVVTALILSGPTNNLRAQPTMLDPNLSVRTVVTGLITPTSMAFLDTNDILVLEKNTGKVQRVVDGVIQGPVLDLPVNFGSELGLLGIALHPDFSINPAVYLYWTESATGLDTSNLNDVPLLGNQVDRFVWDGLTLTFDQNLIRLRAFQEDANQPPRGNHDGGVIRFGPDGKLYIFIGDVGRRGQTQNLPDGPFGPGVPDDQFGGPEPDNAHLSGVILRLNPDGSVPEDNPFFQVGADIGGEVGANIQKIFSYGHRNSFGLAFDPLSGNLWIQENGDDSFSEINRVDPGFNGGWIQIVGPVERIGDFKAIETGQIFPQYNGLQQIRWPPELIADTPEEALSRLFELPGSLYTDPVFSWKFEVAPAGIGFLNSQALGPEFEGDLFVGAARDFLAGGYLFRFKLSEDRSDIVVEDPLLEDRVADNLDKFDITESESLLIGIDFGIGTDIQTGPNGNLFVVSLSNGAIYEIFRTEGLTILSVSPTTVVPGDTVTVSWNGIPSPTPEDWIGLYLQGTDDFQLIDWFYVSCSQIPGDPQADGSCPFVVPATLPEDTYELRLFANGDVTRLATSNPFTVTGGIGEE
ncbi:MAG: PQQ-dependent sugar dehydrogenase [Candidatus Binatia bacterium]